MRREAVLDAIRREWAAGTAPMQEPTGEARGAMGVALRLGFSEEEVRSPSAPGRRRPESYACIHCGEGGAPHVAELGASIHPGCSEPFMEEEDARERRRRKLPRPPRAPDRPSPAERVASSAADLRSALGEAWEEEKAARMERRADRGEDLARMGTGLRPWEGKP